MGKRNNHKALGPLEDDLRPVGLARFGVRRCATARTSSRRYDGTYEGNAWPRAWPAVVSGTAMDWRGVCRRPRWGRCRDFDLWL